MTVRTVLILLLIATTFVVHAADGKGGASGAMLRYGGSSRSLAMGGAYGVVAESGDALIYNPAGLALSERWEFNFMHSQLWTDMRVNYAAFTLPMQGIGSFSASVLNMGIGKIDGRDENNQPTGEFGYGETAVMLGYGNWFLSRKIRAGISAKYYMKTMDSESESGIGGFDIGVSTKDVLKRKFRFGLAIQNIAAGKIAGEDDLDAAPMTLRFGVGYKLLRTLYLTGEAVMAGSEFEPHVGAEYRMSRLLTLRSGFTGKEITFGLGIALDKLAGGNLMGTYPTLDYAAEVMNPIDHNFLRFSLALRGPDTYVPPDVDDPCANLSLYDSQIEKEGLLGAEANILNGRCQFQYEMFEAPLNQPHNLRSLRDWFYYGYDKMGSNWQSSIVTTEGSQEIFHQKTHYMYAETQMAVAIDEETKTLINQLIMLGGDSVQYDSRLQYDLAYTYESLGKEDSAVVLYRNVSSKDADVPEKYLAMLRLGNLLQDSDKEQALEYLESIVTEYSQGFYDDEGNRLSYPFYPRKYSDNNIVDDALLLMGNILFRMEDTKAALAAYLDIILFYPDLEKNTLSEAYKRAAICYDKLGNTKAAEAMRAKTIK